MAISLEQHAKLPPSKAHGKNAKGFYKGGKTDAGMRKHGRGLEKVANQKTGMKKP